MTERPSDKISERLAMYRKMAGLSAEELAELTGTMSRSKIANIESGRKKNISLDDAIDLAVALRIPLVALAAPIERPFARLSVGAVEMSSLGLVYYFDADAAGLGEHGPSSLAEVDAIGSLFPARIIAGARLTKLSEYREAEDKLRYAQHKLRRAHRDGTTDEAVLRSERDARRSELEQRKTELEDLGVDMTRPGEGDDSPSE